MQKILFIEDDLIFLKAYATKLKMEGLEVTAVDNCDEALELIKKDCPDLIILDIMLKGKKNGNLVKKSFNLCMNQWMN